MGSSESDTILGRGLLLECEMGGEIVVYQETEYVADGIGHVDIDPVLQHPVDGVMDSRRCGAYDSKTYQFAECFFLLHICKSNQNIQILQKSQPFFCFF